MEEHEERDDWVERAMKDDCLGAEILMAFTRRPPTPPPTPPPPPPADDLVLDVVRQQPLKWCEKKSRWTPIDVSEIRKFKEEYEKEGGKPSVASPQSPLSWSGGDGGPKKNGGKRRASAAASDKGKSKIDDGSKVKRLKVTIGGDLPKTTLTIGGRTKKKTFEELTEEKNKLELDNADLKKEVEELKAVCDEERRRNQSLKEKVKLYLEPEPSSTNMGLAVASSSSAVPMPPSSSSLVVAVVQLPVPAVFQLPDLNLVPEQETGE